MMITRTRRASGTVAILVALIVMRWAGSAEGAEEGATAAKVVTYPAPVGEALSGDYEITAAGQKVDVYGARVLDPPFAGQYDFGGPYWFASFDLSGRVVVQIRSKRSLRNTVVRPESAGVRVVLVDENTVTLTLDGPRKVSVEPDGKKGPLLLFANPLETGAPRPDEANVVYFGPGVH
ncbi:MAG: hypothetical protein NTU53_15100, partial [Planctomycetota bacterium]|nr:hypothetical protein [Planctomycetota bacterium]